MPNSGFPTGRKECTHYAEFILPAGKRRRIFLTAHRLVTRLGGEGREWNAAPPTGRQGGKLGAKCQVLRAEQNDKKISPEYVDEK